MLRVILVALWLTVATAAALRGLDYYVLPFQERPFVAAHDLFASSGTVGHGYGVAGLLLMVVGVASYSIRKRVKILIRKGKLKHWLELHIFLCTLGPFLVLLHSAFRVGGLVAVAFWSMMVVVVSGVFGRYLYVRIPKTIQGHFLSLENLETRREEAVDAVGARLGGQANRVGEILNRFRPPPPSGLGAAIFLAIRWDLGRRRTERELRRALGEIWGNLRVPDDLMAVWREAGQRELQIALLQPFQRLFHYWHVFHLPLAIVMFLIVIVHVSIAVLFGYAWVL